MSDAVFAAIMVTFFLLAIGLIHLLDRVVGREADSNGFADEPPDTSEASDWQGEPR